jgi:hypothetical protein
MEERPWYEREVSEAALNELLAKVDADLADLEIGQQEVPDALWEVI